MGKWLWLFLVVQLSCFAAPRPVERQVESMRAVLAQADDAYYNRHQPIMCDEAYDALRVQYDRLLAQYPELIQDAGVGAPVKASRERVPHIRPVLSLKKAYSDEEVRAFIKKCGSDLGYCVEPKIDGVSVVLHYRAGVLVQAVTRGDGKAGMDVTPAVLVSGAVPVELRVPLDLVVRGELFMPLTAFEELNRRRLEDKNAPLKSPRNTAAGTLRLHDYAEVARRGLRFLAFELIQSERWPITHSAALAQMQSAGLPVVESQMVSAPEVVSAVESVNRQRSAYPFQSDGVAIKVDECEVFERLGATGHHPRGALARKYRQKPTVTRLLSVAWQEGASGKWTPVARFEPVDIDGATIQKATLHNWSHIQALDLKIGDWIKVIRAGGAIPEICGNCPERRTGNETAIVPPSGVK
ncbi:hypothetical protein ACFLQY_03725 [Verrucomicrobiota bacterium]